MPKLAVSNQKAKRVLQLLQSSKVITTDDKDLFKKTMPTFDGIEKIDLKKYGGNYKVGANNRHLQLLKEID